MTPYVERSPGARAWRVLVVAGLAGWLGLWLAVGRDTWVLPTILVAMLGGIAALAMWSSGRYGNVTVTADALRVGREAVPLADLDPDGVSGPGEPVQGRLLGGAYAPTLGRGVVGVRRLDGDVLLVATRSPEAFRSALTGALTAGRTR